MFRVLGWGLRVQVLTVEARGNSIVCYVLRVWDVERWVIRWISGILSTVASWHGC